MPTALFLSPHLDDVAFSCGGTLVKLAAAGWHCVLATAFTRSVPHPAGFALKCQTDKGLSPEVDYLAVRRAEDAEFGRVVGAAEVLWLDFPEAPHRGYDSAAELFAGVRPGDDVADAVARAVLDLWRRVSPELVFAPQGLGNHADHLQLIAAVTATLPADAVTWYRDTPYALRGPADSPGFGVPIGDHLAVKLDGCAAYRTQLGFQFGGEAGMREALAAFALREGDAAGLAGAAERYRGRPVEPGQTTPPRRPAPTPSRSPRLAPVARPRPGDPSRTG